MIYLENKGRWLAIQRWSKLLTYPIERWPVPARLSNAEQKEKFFEAVLAEGNVTAACAKLGMARGSVYVFAARSKDFKAEFDAVCGYLYRCLSDDAVRIADQARAEGDPFKAPLVRIQCEARWRVAGQHKQNVEVNVDNRTQTVVVGDEQRARLIELRNKALEKKDDGREESTRVLPDQQD